MNFKLLSYVWKFLLNIKNDKDGKRFQSNFLNEAVTFINSKFFQYSNEKVTLCSIFLRSLTPSKSVLTIFL